MVSIPSNHNRDGWIEYGDCVVPRRGIRLEKCLCFPDDFVKQFKFGGLITDTAERVVVAHGTGGEREEMCF